MISTWGLRAILGTGPTYQSDACRLDRSPAGAGNPPEYQHFEYGIATSGVRCHDSYRMCGSRYIGVLILAALVGCGEPSTLPDADYWVGSIGVVVGDGGPSWVGSETMNSELAQIVAEVETATGYAISPFVVQFTPGTLDCGQPQYACYIWGADSGQVSVGFELEGYPTFAPRCLRETYLPRLIVEHEKITGHTDRPALVLDQVSIVCDRFL